MQAAFYHLLQSADIVTLMAVTLQPPQPAQHPAQRTVLIQPLLLVLLGAYFSWQAGQST
jgi:hypothetical protein